MHLETHPFDVIKVLLPNPVKTVLITLNKQHWHFQFIIALSINWYINTILIMSLNFIKGRFVFPLAPLRLLNFQKSFFRMSGMQL